MRRSFSLRIRSKFQPRIRQIQPVHNLIVLIIRGLVWIAGESVHIRAFQINNPAALLVEKRVLSRVIKIVSIVLLVGVGDYLSSVGPRALRAIGFAVPNLTED